MELLETRLAPAYLWTGNGPTNNWSDPQNWRDTITGAAGAPFGGANVIFNGMGANGNKDAVLDGAALAQFVNPPIPQPPAGTLGTFTINGYTGTIAISQNVTVTGQFQQTSGTITGGSDLTLNGPGAWTGGTEGGGGVTFINGVFSTYGFQPTTVTLDGRTLDNSGTISCGASTINATGGAKIRNEASGIIDANNNDPLGANGPAIITGDGELVNYNTVTAESSADLVVGILVTNNGTFVSNSKTTFDATVWMNGGNLEGTGSIQFNANLVVSGGVSSTVSNLIINGGASITAGFSIDSGVCTFQGAQVVIGGSVTVNFGPGSLNINCDVEIAGTLTNNGLVGGVTWSGGNISFQANGTIANNAGTFTITADAQNITGEGTFVNSGGTLRVEKSSTISATFTSTGTVNLVGGTLTLDQAWNQAAGMTAFMGGNLQVNGDFTNGASVVVTTNGSLSIGTFTNNGTLAFGPLPGPPPVPGAPVPPAASLTVASSVGALGGNFTQGGAGQLTMRILGDTNDRLNSNNLNLGGSFTTTIPDGVGIPTNSSWTMLTGQRQGEFPTVNQPPGFLFSWPTFAPAAVRVQNPDFFIPGLQVANENVAIPIAAVNIPDPGAGDALLQVTLSAGSGTLTLSSTNGLTFSTGTGTGDTSMTFVGMISDINAALSTLSYLPNTNFSGVDTLSIVTTDTPASGGSYSDSDSVPITVVEGDTTTSITASASSITYGQSVTFTAVVYPVSPAVGTPTGTVNFLDGATVIGSGTLDSTGATTFTATALGAGSHTIYANYTGNDFNPSTSVGLGVTVNQADTTTTLTTSISTSTYGQSVTLSAAVDGGASGTPTGTVTFYDGATSLGDATLDGAGDATLAVSSLSVGAHSITVSYSGDADFNANTSDATSFTVSQNDTATGITASTNPAVVGTDFFTKRVAKVFADVEYSSLA